MDICGFFRIMVLLTVVSTFSGCIYYYPDLEAESTGSVLGGFAAGLAVAEATADITVWGAGTIVGSVFGGMIGQAIDNNSPLRLDDPPNDPIFLFHYQTLRPPLIQERFYPGAIYLSEGSKQVELRPVP